MENDYKGILLFDEPMSHHTSIGIGGKVEVFAEPEDVLSLKLVLNSALERNMKIYIMGAGTNLLVKDGAIEGLIISTKRLDRIEELRETSEGPVLFVESGTHLASLISFAADKGYSGLEPLAGIPGTIGGAVYMNAGSFGREISELILSVSVMSHKGMINRLTKDELRFTYRGSSFPDDIIILSANLQLSQDHAEVVKKRTADVLNKKKATQPLNLPSAGCVFKNPSPAEPAGKLLDMAGCKGMKTGGAEVSKIHANYIINHGGTSQDFLALVKMAQKKVQEKFNITLEPEIKIIGSE
jgi:UDP-N-acetylmuramate dehydrogenase